MNLKVFNPQVFQGNLRKRNYFEGWYFKHVSADHSAVYSFIPGISISSGQAHAFIQVMNGITGETQYLTYPASQFSWDCKKLLVTVGNSIFSSEGMQLDIANDSICVKGTVNYSESVDYPRRILSPGIMGWYSFVPFMECKHDVVSVTHQLKGSLRVQGNEIDFSDGKGYIEKDWGRSFPKSWLWLQCNHFEKPGTSLMISIADIPWMGSYFLGLICFLYANGKFYLFNTYDRAVIDELSNQEDTIHITLRNKRHLLQVTVRKKKSGELKAPVNGEMSRRIKESIDSEVDLLLLDKENNPLYSDHGQRAGFESIESIFHYLK